MKLKIKLSSDRAKLPEYKTSGSSGMDICSAANEEIILHAFCRAAIPTNLFLEIPKGYEVQIRPRSGLALNNGITVLNTPGTIDEDYRGEVKVILINLSKDPFVIKPGDRIAQMVLCPVVQAEIENVTEISETKRGSGGFGSTGIK